MGGQVHERDDVEEREENNMSKIRDHRAAGEKGNQTEEREAQHEHIQREMETESQSVIKEMLENEMDVTANEKQTKEMQSEQHKGQTEQASHPNQEKGT